MAGLGCEALVGAMAVQCWVTLMPAPYFRRSGLPVSPGDLPWADPVYLSHQGPFWVALVYPSHLCGPKISGPAPPPVFLRVAGASLAGCTGISRGQRL